MTITNLKNITIKKLTDKNMNDYYLIMNNENQDETYFCFKWSVKEGWNELVNNWEQIREVEIEYTENENNFKVYRKAISVFSPETVDFLI